MFSSKVTWHSALRRTKESVNLTLSRINCPCLLPNILNMQREREYFDTISVGAFVSRMVVTVLGKDDSYMMSKLHSARSNAPTVSLWHVIQVLVVVRVPWVSIYMSATPICSPSTFFQSCTVPVMISLPIFLLTFCRTAVRTRSTFAAVECKVQTSRTFSKGFSFSDQHKTSRQVFSFYLIVY